MVSRCQRTNAVLHDCYFVNNLLDDVSDLLCQALHGRRMATMVCPHGDTGTRCQVVAKHVMPVMVL